MEVEFEDVDLAKIEADKDFTGTLSKSIISVFRKRMWFIRSASDERDFYALKSLNFKRLKGNRNHEYSMRLNDQWRLILVLSKETHPKTVIVVGIEDYH